ncbi:MAG: PrsW family glutamic-type intramembrane protease [Bythopirellula sp.]
MTWRQYLQSRTRQPEFLWRMVIWILAAGIALGFVAEKTWQPQQTDAAAEVQLNQAWKDSQQLAEQGQWWRLWWSLPPAVYHRFHGVGPLALSIIAGCCWFLFLWQALRAPGWRDIRLWAALMAIACGVLSIWPTHFFSLWQEYRWNLHNSQELIPGLRYWVLGVGLREEVAKLLCVLPLIPVLMRVRDELTALLVSACVGLGFAVVENVNYFAGAGGIAVMGRFLTANPFHMTLTGLAGLMLYRVLRNPRGWGSHALSIFGILIFAHGLYDAFIALPDLVDYGIFNTIIFALVVYQFFHELRELRKNQRDTVSLSANFLFGVSVLTASTFVYLSARFGMSIAFDALASGVFGLAVMVYLFLREMPDTMVSV